MKKVHDIWFQVCRTAEISLSIVVSSDGSMHFTITLKFSIGFTPSELPGSPTVTLVFISLSFIIVLLELWQGETHHRRLETVAEAPKTIMWHY